MTARTSTTMATFAHPFVLSGVERRLPPGTYEVETEEEALEGVSFLAYRRVSTHLLWRDQATGFAEMVPINPADLEQALEEDAAQSQREITGART